MRNYLLAILFILFGHKIGVCNVFSSPTEIVKVSLQTEEEKSEEKIHQFKGDTLQTDLHANVAFPLIIFEVLFKQNSITHSHRASGFADRPFTPPDFI